MQKKQQQAADNWNACNQIWLTIGCGEHLVLGQFRGQWNLYFSFVLQTLFAQHSIEFLVCVYVC